MSFSRALVTTLLFAFAAPRAAAAIDLRIGGTFGFGLTAREQAGDFKWDWNSAREETSLVELRFGIRPLENLQAFIAFGARFDTSREDDGLVLQLREGLLRYDRYFGNADSLAVVLFARQPSWLWLDHGLASYLEPRRAGDNVQGVRANLRWRALYAAIIAADQGGVEPALAPEAGGDGDVVVFRARGDLAPDVGLRVGGTWVRHLPAGAPTRGDPARVDVLRRDHAGIDLRLLLRGVQLQLDYSQISSDYAQPGAQEAQEPGLRRHWDWGAGGRLTDVMPTTAALLAEVRAPALGSSRWGWVGFAPAFRAVGRHHTNRLRQPLREPGSPTRGVEGYRAEVWYRLPARPVWARYGYERSTQFADADRRVIRQTGEVEAIFVPGVAGRLLYVQRQIEASLAPHDEHHNDLLTELRATHAGTRFRAQLAFVDLDTPARRELFALEAGARLTSRVQAVGRVSFANDATGVRRALFAELQYWHLPHFELALHYGAEWVGDRADPVFDPDLVASAANRDVVRLHFRGWF
jgi:hypothetical protein